MLNISQELMHLGFCTNVVYDLVYYGKENQLPSAYSYYFIIFLPLQFSNITLFLGSVSLTELKPRMHNGNRLIYCVYQNQASSAYFVP